MVVQFQYYRRVRLKRMTLFEPPPFTYGERVKEGAFGEVHIGTLTETDTSICIKIARNSKDPTFEKEFKLLARLRNKDAIIQTFGYAVIGSERCIVLELANGSLSDLLEMPRHTLGLPMWTVMNLVGDLAKALKVLVSMKIAHRDIKPLNILYFTDSDPPKMGQRYTFKLCDFGLGRLVQSTQHSFHTVGGTSCYMAPQMLARILRVDGFASMTAEVTDLWSLGITLYQCVTGQLPFFPKQFSDQKLYELIKGRPNDKVIGYHQGQYVEMLHSDIHPSWFLEMMTILIQFLLDRQRSESVANLMSELAHLRSRVVYNAEKNEFLLNHPQLASDHVWFMDQWRIKPEEVGICNGRRVCVLNEKKDVCFLGGDGDAPPSEINNVPGNFLMVCDVPLDDELEVEGTTTPPINDERMPNHTQSRGHFAAMSYYDLISLQMQIVNIHRVANAIASQRIEGINRLKAALNMGLHSARDVDLRLAAVTAYKTRMSEEFQMSKDLEQANIVDDCMKYLVELDEVEQSVQYDEQIQLKLIALMRFVGAARRNLQVAVEKNRSRMMSSLRKIVKFNDLAEKLEAEFNAARDED